MIDLYSQLNHCVLSLVFATCGGLFRMFACDFVTTLATACGNGGSLRLSQRHAATVAACDCRNGMRAALLKATAAACNFRNGMRAAQQRAVGGSLRLTQRHAGGAASANGRLAATEGRLDSQGKKCQRLAKC